MKGRRASALRKRGINSAELPVTERQIVAKTMAALPLVPVERFYRHDENGVTDQAITAAEEMMAIEAPGAAASHQALGVLDDYNHVIGAFGEAMFLLGISYGVKTAAASEAPVGPRTLGEAATLENAIFRLLKACGTGGRRLAPSETASIVVLFTQLDAPTRRLVLRSIWRFVPVNDRADARLLPARSFAPSGLEGLPGRSGATTRPSTRRRRAEVAR